MSWVESVFQVTRGQVIAIDGKILHSSHDRANGKSVLHLVSAWATANGLSLGRQKVADKSNEIVAIPVLLKQLYLRGCMVTIDAMGCQSDLAHQMDERKADYVLALKGNQPRLLKLWSSGLRGRSSATFGMCPTGEQGARTNAGTALLGAE